MAKALLGHLATSQDWRVTQELRSLRERVGRLETENAQLRLDNAALTADGSRLAAQNNRLTADNDRLVAALAAGHELADHDLLTLTSEPALT